MPLVTPFGDPRGIAGTLAGLAGLAGSVDLPRQAARLLGAAEAIGAGEGVRNLVAQATPVDFSKGGVYTLWTSAENFDVDSLVDAVQERVAAGERLKDAAAAVAEAAGVPKRELYNAALAARG